MHTASFNFSHQVATHKRPRHQLVTEGIYGWCRHPSYFGFFSWAIGTQLILLNPLCLVGFTVILYRYFQDRIQFEEEHLVEFFGQDYVCYRQRVWSGIPFYDTFFLASSRSETSEEKNRVEPGHTLKQN